MNFAGPARVAAALLVAAAALASTDAARATPCERFRDELRTAFAEAPDMALGNRSKVERLLRDAEVAETDTICMTKLRRAHELVERAYTDAGERLDLAPPRDG
jgi:hypothetical protein